MIRVSQATPSFMEFTTFTKASNVTDEELISLVMKFENDYLQKQSGLIFHCLVRNLKGEYANLLFADNMENMKSIEYNFASNDCAKDFMAAVNPQTVKVRYHEVLDNNFQVPKNFACFEHGTFSPKKDNGFSESNLLSVANKIEEDHLNTFENSLGHFIGKLDDETYSEITFGQTLGKTREICFGYLNIKAGLEMMDMFNSETIDLDFWYLIA
jgi:hypothetical protein